MNGNNGIQNKPDANSQQNNFYQRINSLYVNIDGASRGNPGEASIAVVVRSEDKQILEEYCELIGSSTSNVAEYTAALKALEIAAKYCRDEVRIFSDSKLLVNHANGTYRIKDGKLFKLLIQIKSLESLFRKVRYFYVDRRYNQRADELANKVFQIKNANNFGETNANQKEKF